MSNKKRTVGLVAAVCIAAVAGGAWGGYHKYFQAYSPASRAPLAESADKLTPFQKSVLSDLNRQCASGIIYQDGYFSGGEPPPKIGVCTDVVIRSYRAAGVDLQTAVAADIAAAPEAYHIARPDPNIDHRRCRNLTIFFRRHARTLPASGPNADWEPGDIVFWDTFGDGQAHHVGVIANHLGASGAPTVTHHWPGQIVSEMDWLYRLHPISHYRWRQSDAARAPHSV
ncbi:hypothetical protein CCAX7_46050 [Capsulimonas corticalis]|uniref:Uncharacterized protein n=1 Tax=Capsulimonas corticalis TaxID=2219043 RepID=A0A402D561_9BACT|nr:DUF1287 domain-containing protein [Capsulimonas corticalis]BDI32554.1 hypothetical protein CCAX7_46050 [Capsulimonas corticalis]